MPTCREVLKYWFVALTLALTGGAHADEVLVRRPLVIAGDQWTYRTDSARPGSQPRTDLETFQVSFADDKVILVVASRKAAGTSDEARETDVTTTPEWNVVSSGPRAGRPTLVVRPHGGLFRFPLKLGDTYEANYEIEGAKFVYSYRRSVKALRWEEVTVPAGRFRALVVESAGTFEQVGGPQRGRTLTRCWYVPEIRRWVKILQEFGDDRLESELIGYKLAPD